MNTQKITTLTQEIHELHSKNLDLIVQYKEYDKAYKVLEKKLLEEVDTLIDSGESLDLPNIYIGPKREKSEIDARGLFHAVSNMDFWKIITVNSAQMRRVLSETVYSQFVSTELTGKRSVKLR